MSRRTALLSLTLGSIFIPAKTTSLPNEIQKALVGCYLSNPETDCNNGNQYTVFKWNSNDDTYKFSSIDVWEYTPNTIYGMQMTFTNASLQTILSPMLGATAGALSPVVKVTYPIDTTKTIVSMDHYGFEFSSGLRFNYDDSTSTVVGPVNTGQTLQTTTIAGPVIGMHAVYQKNSSGSLLGLSGANIILSYYKLTKSMTNLSGQVGNACGGCNKMWDTNAPSGIGETFSAVLTKNGNSIAIPTGWFDLNLTGRTLTVTTQLTSGITLADAGVYVLTITGTLPNNINPATGLPWTVIQTVQVTILSDCADATQKSGALPDLTAYIGFALTQALPYSDNISDSHNNPLYCDRTYTFTSSSPFASIVGTPKQLSIFTTDQTLIGQAKTVSLQVALVEKPTLVFTDSFIVTFKEPCQSIVFGTSAALVTNVQVVMPSTNIQTQDFTTNLTQYFAPFSTYMPSCPINPSVTCSPAATAISITGGNSVQVDASQITLPSGLGTYACTLTIMSLNYHNNPVTQIQANFNVIVSCPLTDFYWGTTTAIPDQIYNIGDPSLTTPSQTTGLTPACQYLRTRVSSFFQNGVQIALPSWIIFNPASYDLTIQTNNESNSGSYSVTVASTLSGVINQATGSDWIITKSFNIFIRVPGCNTATLNNGTFNDMIFEIGSLASTQVPPLKDSHATPTVCGPRVVTFSPTSASSYLSFDGTSVVLSTTDVSLIGPHSITMTIGFQDYPLNAQLTKNFIATIKCSASSIQFTNSPTQIIYTPGVSLEPVSHEEPIIQTCGSTPTYTLTYVTPALTSTYTGSGSLSETTLASGFKLAVQGFSRTIDIGLYQFTLSAAVLYGPTVTTTFDLKVVDPCQNTNFVTTAPYIVSDMAYDFINLPQSTQTNIVTQVYLNTNGGVSCPKTLSLTPVSAIVSLQGTQIVVDGTSMTAGDFGTMPFILKASSSALGVPSQDYNFKVQLTCTVQLIATNPSTLSVVHYLAGLPYAATTLALPTFAFTPSICSIPVTITQVQNAATMLVAPEITISGSQIIVDSQDVNLAGTQTYILTANAASTTYIIGKTLQFNLMVNFRLCEDTKLIPPTFIQQVQYMLGNPNQSELIPPFQDTIANQKSQPTLCGLRVYSLATTSPFISLTPASLSATENLSFQVSSNDIKMVGMHSVTISASLLSYSGVAASQISFSVQILDPCPTTIIQPSQKIEDMTIYIGETLTQEFKQFQDKVAAQFNVVNLCGERTYTILGAKSFIYISAPIDPWFMPQKINLSAISTSFVGVYTFKLEVRLVTYNAFVLPFTQEFKVTILKPNSAPIFKPPLPQVIPLQKTNTPENWSFALPSLYDEDTSDTVTFSYDLGYSKFVSVKDRGSEGIFLYVDDVSSDYFSSGSYLMTFTLDDSKAKTKYFSRLMVFAAIPIEKIEEAAEEQEACEWGISVPDFSSAVSYVSGTGPVMVTWKKFELTGTESCTKDKKIKITLNASWVDDRFTEQSEWLQFTQNSISNENETNFFSVNSKTILDKNVIAGVTVTAEAEDKKAEFSITVTILPGQNQTQKEKEPVKPPVVKLIEISESSLVTLYWSSPIIVYDKPIDTFMKTPEKFLKFSILKNPKSSYWDDINYIESGNVLSVQIKYFTAKEIQVQLEFSNPLYVSRDTFNRDTLIVTIVDESTFISAIDFVTTAKKFQSSQLDIFRLLSSEMKEQVETMERGTKSINAFITSSMPLNLVLGVSLKFLWGMVNSLQFIVYMDQWKVNWPPNALVAIKTIRMIALAEFFDPNQLKNKAFDYFGFPSNDKFDEEATNESVKVQTQPPERRLAVVKSQQGVRVDRLMIFIVLTLVLFGLLALAIFVAFKSRYKQYLMDLYREFKNALFFNGWIRLYLQGFLKFAMVIGAFFSAIYFGTKKISAKSILWQSACSAILFVGVPIVFVCILKRNRHQLKLKRIRDMYGSLYLGVNTDIGPRVYFVIEQISIRLLFTVITFSLIRVPGILINTYLFLNNMHIIYLGWYTPYDTKNQNNLELCNSWMLHMAGYTMILLANLMNGPHEELNVGWGLISCIGLIFIINFSFMMTLNVQKAYAEFKYWWLRRKIKSAIAKRAKQQLLEKEIQDALAKDAQIIEVVLKPLQENQQVAQSLARISVIEDASILSLPKIEEEESEQHDSVFISSSESKKDSVFISSAELEKDEVYISSRSDNNELVSKSGNGMMEATAENFLSMRNHQLNDLAFRNLNQLVVGPDDKTIVSNMMILDPHEEDKNDSLSRKHTHHSPAISLIQNRLNRNAMFHQRAPEQEDQEAVRHKVMTELRPADLQFLALNQTFDKMQKYLTSQRVTRNDQ